MRITWRQALAFRMRRHMLDPIGELSAPEVVGRLCGVQAQVASSAELAIRLRQSDSGPGEVAQALASGRLIKTWAMRGTLHLFKAEEAGGFLSLLAAARPWERPSWQRYFGVSPEHIELLRQTVREALTGPALTRDELIEAVVARLELSHIGESLRSGWGTLLKPLAWQGDLCFGPNRGNRVTFLHPEVASTRWVTPPPAEEAAPVAIAAYLRAHGPATADAFGGWLSGGWFGKRQLRSWFHDLGDRLVEVDVEGRTTYVLAQDADELAAANPTKEVRLLAGFDQYVMAPGTADTNVVPAPRRSAVSKQSGWISPVVVAGGVVCGTWEMNGDRASVSWFGEAGRAPLKLLHKEVDRLSTILDSGLELSLEVS